MNTEPALIISAIGGIITAAIPLLAKTLGWDDALAAEWETLLQAVLILAGVILTGAVIRSRVYSPSTYQKDVQAALYSPPPSDGGPTG